MYDFVRRAGPALAMSYELRLLLSSLAAGVVVAFGAWVFWRVRLERRRRAARAALGDAALLAQREPREGFAVLEGELVCDVPIERIDDGGASAVSCVSVSPARRPKRYFANTWASSRAEQLSLRWRGCEIAIDGPVRVALGSRRRHLRGPLRSYNAGLRERAARAGASAFEDAEVSCDSLAAGDRVFLSGELTQAAANDGAVGYRQSAHRWKLTPRGAHIDMVFAGRARTPRSLLVVLATTIVLAAGLGQLVGAAVPSGPLPLAARVEAAASWQPASDTEARRAPFAANVSCRRCFWRTEAAASTPQLCCGDPTD